MTAIDFAAIQVGDKVKIRWGGLVSEDWMEVIAVSSDDWVEVNGWRAHQEPRGIDIIAHQPAPRKVEVTLGQPLPIHSIEAFHGLPAGRQLIVHHAIPCVQLTIHDREGRATGIDLDTDDLRSLALLLLATVGTE